MIKAEPLVRINEFKQTVIFDWYDIQEALFEVALKKSTSNFNKDSNYEVELKEKTEGSPGYKIGYVAIVRLKAQA